MFVITGEMKSEIVKEGESVTLHTGFTEIQIYDFITWMFGETVIAEIYKAAQLSYILYMMVMMKDSETDCSLVIKLDL